MQDGVSVKGGGDKVGRKELEGAFDGGLILGELWYCREPREGL
jgi:hypothetical protein